MTHVSDYIPGGPAKTTPEKSLPLQYLNIYCSPPTREEVINAIHSQFKYLKASVLLQLRC